MLTVLNSRRGKQKETCCRCPNLKDHLYQVFLLFFSNTARKSMNVPLLNATGKLKNPALKYVGILISSPSTKEFFNTWCIQNNQISIQVLCPTIQS